MKTRFTVYKGEFNFVDNQIIITDGIFKWHKYFRIAIGVFYILGGGYILVRSLINQNYIMVLLGGAILIFGIVGLIITLKVNTNKTLDLRQVEKAVIKEDFISYLNLTIHLKNSQKRKVALDFRDEDHFRKLYVKELIETLNSLSIITELK